MDNDFEGRAVHVEIWSDIACPWCAVGRQRFRAALAGCGEGDKSNLVPAPRPSDPGLAVAQQSGCLACHVIGDRGHDGPGQDLTTVGARFDRAELERVLVDPPAPMPSYARLSREDLDDLVGYLATLR